jgi:hypothetical protein
MRSEKAGWLTASQACSNMYVASMTLSLTLEGRAFKVASWDQLGGKLLKKSRSHAR